MSDVIDLQKRLDDLANRLPREDRLLVWEARSAIFEREERLQTIERAVRG